MGVTEPFAADGCRGTVTGIYPRAVVEDEKVLPDGTLQCMERAARQINPANGAVEKGIAGKNDSVTLAPEAATARRMPRCVDYLQDIAAKMNAHAMFKETVRLGSVFRHHPEIRRRDCRRGGKIGLPLMDQKVGAGCIMEFPDRSDVIEMTMGVQKIAQR